MSYELRPYQLAGVHQVRTLFKDGARSFVLVLYTGGGKTLLAAHLAGSMVAKGRRGLFIAHRIELIKQAFCKFVRSGIDPQQIGIVWAEAQRERAAADMFAAGHASIEDQDELWERYARARPKARVQIASIDTLRRRTLPPADVVFVDEAHVSLAPKYVRLLTSYRDRGAVLVGLTATPARTDGKGLGALYERLVLLASPSQLIADGFIAEPVVYTAPEQPSLSKLKKQAGDFAEGALEQEMNTVRLVGNLVEHYKRLAEDRRAFVFGVTVRHSQNIAATFQAAGIPAEHLDGNTPTLDRAAILARLRRGETRVVSNVGCLCEGTDEPSVKCLLLARPTMSTTLHIQQCGRALRPWHGITPIILDHAGNTLRHGLPEEERAWTLEDGVDQSGAKECPRCQRTISRSRRICSCGYEFPESAKRPAAAGDGEPLEVREEEGELVRARRVAKQLGLKLPSTMAEKREVWAKLEHDWRLRSEACLKTGRPPPKPGTMFHRYRDLVKSDPPNEFKLPAFIYATPEQKRAEVARLREMAQTRGSSEHWVAVRFERIFGHPFDARSYGQFVDDVDEGGSSGMLV